MEKIRLAMEKIRLAVDMDGVLAEFQRVDTLETLYEKGYFFNLKPIQNVVDAIRDIVFNHPEVEVYIMTSVLSDSKYALEEKNQWLDKYLPEIEEQRRIFPPCGENKLEYMPGGIRETDFLLDDYTNNLTLWEPPARGIKLLNGINHTRETWRGNRLRYDKSPEELAENIVDVVINGVIIQDSRPQETEVDNVILKMEENLHNVQRLNNELKKVLPTNEKDLTIEENKKTKKSEAKVRNLKSEEKLKIEPLKL